MRRGMVGGEFAKLPELLQRPAEPDVQEFSSHPALGKDLMPSPPRHIASKRGWGDTRARSERAAGRSCHGPACGIESLARCCAHMTDIAHLAGYIMSPRPQSLLDFWGKASPTNRAGISAHSIAYHSLDVAAVGAELIWRDRGRLTRIAAATGVKFATLASALPFLIALHDVGKYGRVFQAKSPANWPSVLGPYRQIPPGNSHVTTGFQILVEFSDDGLVRDIFDAVLPGWRASDRKVIFRALAGHHGKPPEEGKRSSIGQQDVCPACVAAAQKHIRAMYELLRPDALPCRSQDQLTILAVGLSGLFVLSDWIGSAERWFEYAAPIDGDVTFELYWRRARAAAKAAVDQTHVSSALVRDFSGISEFIPDRCIPSPVQAFAETALLANGPSLVIVEDVTGSGKTEAAMVLAHRLMAAGGRATGLYVALPTEATANAMWERLGSVFRRLFAPDATPSLVLAHGRRALHKGFQDSVVDPAARLDARNGAIVAGDQERPSSAECADWIADDRRKAFLADVGAGTIDQALLAILPVKHQSLRLWGLADRVLIVDEAHAYDAYMTRELEALLEFHAALGGSSIILSATLPMALRCKLVGAFRKGVAGIPAAVELQVTDYPLVTIVGLNKVKETPQPIRNGLARFVAATRVDDLDEAIVRVTAAAETGACVAFVRNSVDEAMAACHRLRAAGLDSLLFHARFAMSDRQRIEADVMRRFGHDADAGMRRGRVLVATQVIEQSLDLDFDLMVTDLAPIDLLIQRAGRLWRHARGARPIAGPELIVLSGLPIDAPDKDWANRVLGRGARVYPDHALLWRSARALFRAGGIATPGCIRTLVESVYDEATREEAPPALLHRELRAAGEVAAASSIAQTNVLLLRPQGGRTHAGYSADAGAWDSDVRTPTRLSNDSLRIRLGRLVDGVVLAWAEADGPWRSWALSEVSVRVGRISGEDSDSAIAGAVAAAKARWPEPEREVPLIALQEEGSAWCGKGCDPRGEAVQIRYDSNIGLSFRDSENHASS
jgi:CRISPR-associated endonuclease/helicase Cas3